MSLIFILSLSQVFKPIDKNLFGRSNIRLFNNPSIPLTNRSSWLTVVLYTCNLLQQ